MRRDRWWAGNPGKRPGTVVPFLLIVRRGWREAPPDGRSPPSVPLCGVTFRGRGFISRWRRSRFPASPLSRQLPRGLSPRPSPGRCRLPLPIPVTWQSARPRSSGAGVTALACCWDPANKPFIPPEETKWQARGRRLPRGQGHAPAQRRVRGRRGCRDSGLQSLSPVLISRCLLVFSHLLQLSASLYLYLWSSTWFYFVRICHLKPLTSLCSWEISFTSNQQQNHPGDGKPMAAA